MSTTTASVSTMSIPLGKDGKKAANIPEKKKRKTFKQFWYELQLQESERLLEAWEVKRVLTHNDTDVDTTGTRKFGQINISYNDLVKKFGKPMEADDEDEPWRVEWDIDFYLEDPVEDDSTWETVTIYDWNQHDTPVEDIKVWNVGAKSKEAYKVLLDYLGLK